MWSYMAVITQLVMAGWKSYIHDEVSDSLLREIFALRWNLETSGDVFLLVVTTLGVHPASSG